MRVNFNEAESAGEGEGEEGREECTEEEAMHGSMSKGADAEKNGMEKIDFFLLLDNWQFSAICF